MSLFIETDSENRDFLYNLASIMTLAVVGTLFNTFAVGLSLYGFGCLYGNFMVEDHFDPCQVNSLQKGKSRHTFNFILNEF